MSERDERQRRRRAGGLDLGERGMIRHTIFEPMGELHFDDVSAAWRTGRAATCGGRAGRGRRAPVHGGQAARHGCVCHVLPAMHTAKARVCRVPRAKHTANIFFLFNLYFHSVCLLFN